MKPLRLASCMAENSEAVCRALADYIGLRLEIPTEYITRIPWQEREALFDRGEIQILWLCGLPYVHKADLAERSMDLLAVPVAAGARYASRPVYFSDVVVRRASRFHQFADLRGARWAYNEPRSHSGYNVVRAHLAMLGAVQGFFATAVEAGAHARSLAMVLDGSVDGAAIDSTVLQWIGTRSDAVSNELRVIETLGPSPIPPWVVSTQVDRALRTELRQLLFDLNRDPAGALLLQRAGLERFVAGADRDYDPIRWMARAAENVSLT